MKTEHHHREDHSSTFEKRTRLVVIISLFTMILEIFFGYRTQSMALLSDGYHMATHVFALGLTWLAYIVLRRLKRSKKKSFDNKKILALSGYTSAIVLLMVAIVMAVESIDRLLHPLFIQFEEAIIVAIIGLLVNLISALVLHHKHEDHDHNIRSAYLHVLADALTSITAIAALVIGMLYQIQFLDSIGGIISAIVIIKWALGLIRSTAKELTI